MVATYNFGSVYMLSFTRHHMENTFLLKTEVERGHSSCNC